MYAALITIRCEGCGQVWHIAQLRDSDSDAMIKQKGGTICDLQCKAKGTDYQAPVTVLGATPILEMYHSQPIALSPRSG